MNKQHSKYCQCEKPNILYGKTGNAVLCTICRKLIKISIRKTWKIKPVTKIEKDKTKYDRNKEKQKFNLDIKKGDIYDEEKNR